MTVKSLAKALLPKPLLELIRRRRRDRKSMVNRGRSVREVFSRIYREGEWGPGYSSGSGSANAGIVGPYVALISAHLESLDREKTVVVDLGCGDFQVGRHFTSLCASYQAVDVVPDLIERHRASGHGAHVAFHCLDMIEDELPGGDVCFVRQVLQHLSNAQIQKILPRLGKYRTVFITEHYPSGDALVPNVDKVHGADIRLYSNSAVCLDAPPFNLRREAMQVVLEGAAQRGPDGEDAGVIRTYRIDMPRALGG
jgi:hypothetical protein